MPIVRGSKVRIGKPPRPFPEELEQKEWMVEIGARSRSPGPG
jgi:hypothetical protein